jgi:hypothetical protein
MRRPPVAAMSPSAAYRIGRQAGRTSFPLPWRVPRQCALDQQVTLKLRYRRDHAHGHLASGARQIDTAQRQAVNRDAHMVKPLDRRLNIDGVAPQAIRLGHHEHVVAPQPIEQLQEARTLFDSGPAGHRLGDQGAASPNESQRPRSRESGSRWRLYGAQGGPRPCRRAQARIARCVMCWPSAASGDHRSRLRPASTNR